MSSPKPIKNFINDLVLLCHKNNISLVLKNAKTIKISGDSVSGYFDSDKIVVAMRQKRSYWLSTLVHESCHLDQYLEDSKWYHRMIDHRLDEWIGGTHVANIKKHVQRIIKLEYDCEVRSLAKIKKYGLPINLVEAEQRKRLHIYYYNWVLKNRRYISKNVFSNDAMKMVNIDVPLRLSDLPKIIERYYDAQC